MFGNSLNRVYTGGNGRGILLFDRLPEGADVAEQLLAWMVSVGRAGTGGVNDAKHGYILQKAVEHPHLLDRGTLLQHWPGGFPRSDEVPTVAIVQDVPQELYKWSWRIWVLGSMGADPGPSAWLYKESYLDLSGLPFTRKLYAGAHVSNLQPPGRYFASFHRQWDLKALGQYFLHSSRTKLRSQKGADLLAPDVLATTLMPQVGNSYANHSL